MNLRVLCVHSGCTLRELVVGCVYMYIFMYILFPFLSIYIISYFYIFFKIWYAFKFLPGTIFIPIVPCPSLGEATHSLLLYPYLLLLCIRFAYTRATFPLFTPLYTIYSTPFPLLFCSFPFPLYLYVICTPFPYSFRAAFFFFFPFPYYIHILCIIPFPLYIVIYVVIYVV